MIGKKLEGENSLSKDICKWKFLFGIFFPSFFLSFSLDFFSQFSGDLKFTFCSQKNQSEIFNGFYNHLPTFGPGNRIFQDEKTKIPVHKQVCPSCFIHSISWMHPLPDPIGRSVSYFIFLSVQIEILYIISSELSLPLRSFVLPQFTSPNSYSTPSLLALSPSPTCLRFSLARITFNYTFCQPARHLQSADPKFYSISSPIARLSWLALAFSRLLSFALACTRLLLLAFASPRLLSLAVACSYCSQLLSLALACSWLFLLTPACSRLNSFALTHPRLPLLALSCPSFLLLALTHHRLLSLALAFSRLLSLALARTFCYFLPIRASDCLPPLWSLSLSLHISNKLSSSDFTYQP